MNKKKLTTQITDGGYSENLYTKIPCTIGYVYMRVEVDGKVKPCCISRVSTGNITKSSVNEIWHGKRQQAFREKLEKINVDHFHQHDPEWAFCQQCSHSSFNRENAEILNKKLK